MSALRIRKGETLDLTFDLSDGFEGIESLTFYIGVQGDPALLTLPATIDGEEATISELIDLDVATYNWQLTAIFDDDTVEKYPDYAYYDDLPGFRVLPALDDA